MNRTRAHRRAGALALLLGGLAAAAAVAQTPATEPPAAGYTERVDVELVTVDVWVADSEGQPVTGLEADSFTVLHDGQPARITHFSEVRRGDWAGPAGEESSPSPRGFLPIPTAPAHLVVYFDRSRIHPRSYPALIESLGRFLDAEAIDSERVLVLRQDRALAVEAAFGSSRQELEQAFDRVAKGTPSGLDLETETRQALEAIREGWDQAQDLVGSALAGLAAVPGTSGEPGGSPTSSPGGAGPRAVVGGVGSGSGPDACGMFVTQIQPTLDAWASAYGQGVRVTLTNLSSAAGFLAGLPGIKTVLYLADGLQTQPGADLATYASTLCPGAGADLLTGTLADQMSNGFLELTRHANANRVTIYSLQTSGLRALATGEASASSGPRGGSGPRARRAFETTRRTADRDGLGLLATETGGRLVLGQNELAPALVKIGEDTRHYYSLGYEPPAGSTGGERRDHRIEVRLANDSLTTRYRRGYLEKDNLQRLTERIEGALNLGLTSNPLEVRLGAGALQESSPGRFRMAMHVMVPVERLAFLPSGDSYLADIVLRVMARPMDGSTMLVQDRSFQIEGAPGATGLANLPVELELTAGTHVTAIGVQDANARQASFISTTLQIGPGG